MENKKKILYLTISNIKLYSNGLYSDLINMLSKKYDITMIKPRNEEEIFYKIKNIKIYTVDLKGLYSKNTFIKGINNLLLEFKYKKIIKKYLTNYKYDFILYATPPITLFRVIKFAKNKFNCQSYLMLKDIFPQNAVDIEMFNKNSLAYKLFRKKEVKLYEISDYIGCMSEANIKYILKNENWIDKNKLELFPNTIKVKKRINYEKVRDLKKYGINNDDLVFIFGGNLGKPQGINFLLSGIEKVKDIKDVKFIIIGSGTEVEKVIEASKRLENLTFVERLPKEEYDLLVKQCDVGILSLDYRFTIPNYPSRTLSYMESAMPIFACTDRATDIKELIEKEAKCGKWCFSNDLYEFEESIKWFINNKDRLSCMGIKGREYLEKNFNVERSVKILENHFNK